MRRSVSSLETSLQRSGIVVTTYEGQEPTPEDVLITDEVVSKNGRVER